MQSPFLNAPVPLRHIGWFLSGVCHQFPEHSLFVTAVQLPLCARCTGTYLGALTGLVSFWRAGRTRASWLPPMRVVALLFLFFALWALDGLNSYWNYVTGRVLLYMPSQLLRLATGMLNGLGLSALVYPMFNFTMWRQPSRQRVIRNWRELAGILGLLAAQIALLLAGIGPLLYPFALLNMIGVLVMLTLVNGIIAVLLLRRENRAQDGRQAVLPLGLGFLLSIAEVGVMAMLRHLLAPALFPSLL